MTPGSSLRQTLKGIAPVAVLFLVAACTPDSTATTKRSRGGVAAAVIPGDEAEREDVPADVRPAATNDSSGMETSITNPAVLEGLRIYRAQYCGTCHQLGLAGTRGTFGPSHDSLRANAERRIRDDGYTGSATTAEAYVRESLLEPGAYRVPGFEHTRFLMPAYTQLNESDLDALVRMLLWDPTTEGG